MITNESQKYGPVIQQYLSSGSGVAYIISPFISIHTLQKILGSSKNAIIVTSWKREHLSAGVSSIDLYPVCKTNGWVLYINSSLHAKIYSNSLESCYIGSANCTDKALFLADGNIECLNLKKDLDISERCEINRILLKSTLVDDEVYELYKEWTGKIESEKQNDVIEPDISSMKNYPLLQLPATDDPTILYDYLNAPEKYHKLKNKIEHDLALFSPLTYCPKDEFFECCKQNFFESRFIKAVDEIVGENGASFGEVSEKIHDMCTDRPKPHRKDVKPFVHNLFQWFVELEPDIYEIYVPRHSEILRRKS